MSCTSIDSCLQLVLTAFICILEISLLFLFYYKYFCIHSGKQNKIPETCYSCRRKVLHNYKVICCICVILNFLTISSQEEESIHTLHQNLISDARCYFTNQETEAQRVNKHSQYCLGTWLQHQDKNPVTNVLFTFQNKFPKIKA